jgi:hypothetical protein
MTGLNLRKIKGEKMNKKNIIKNIVAAVIGRQFKFAVIVVTVFALVFAVSFARAHTVSDRTASIAQPAGAGDVVAEWHREAVRLTVLPTSGLAPVQQTRTMAIVQVAVHDAVNGITGEFETYASHAAAPADASPKAAAIAASHYALRNLFPGHAASLDSLFLTSLAAHELSVDDPGVGYGINAAAMILALRANDGSAAAQYNYTAPGAGLPGIWAPLTALPALLPGWGDVTPWVLRSGTQFRPEAPPALDSEQYAADYNEIKVIGALNSPTRTTEQTQIATFWLASPVAIWSQPLEQLNALHNFSLSERARGFALVYLASVDSGIACWDAKYEYNFWRPQPAIRRADEDGNDATAADPTWVPLFPTPRHPEYPSGHSTVSSGMVLILQQLFGDNPDVPIVSTITGITREWDTFSEGIDEVIDARVYSGIHFRTADEVGSKHGEQVGRFVLTHELRPCRGRGARCF